MLYALTDERLSAAEMPEAISAEGRNVLSQCRLDDARLLVNQLRAFERDSADKCVAGYSDGLQKQVDQAIRSGTCGERDRSSVKPPAATPLSNCVPAADSEAQKKALHARIQQYLKFRKDGGDQWHPDHTMRAGYSVGSVTLKATAMQLAAMSKLIDDYHAAYQRYWSYHEGQRPGLVVAI